MSPQDQGVSLTQNGITTTNDSAGGSLAQSQQAAFQANAQRPNVDLSILSQFSPEQLAAVAHLIQSGALNLQPTIQPVPTATSQLGQIPAAQISQSSIPQPSIPMPLMASTQQAVDIVQLPQGIVPSEPTLRNSHTNIPERLPALLQPAEQSPYFSEDGEIGSSTPTTPKDDHEEHVMIQHDAASRTARPNAGQRLHTPSDDTLQRSLGPEFYEQQKLRVESFVRIMHEKGYGFANIKNEVTDTNALRDLYQKLNLPTGVPQVSQPVSRATVPPVVSNNSTKSTPLVATSSNRQEYLARLQAAKHKKTEIPPSSKPEVSKPKNIDPEKMELLRQKLALLRAQQQDNSSLGSGLSALSAQDAALLSAMPGSGSDTPRDREVVMSSGRSSTQGQNLLKRAASIDDSANERPLDTGASDYKRQRLVIEVSDESQSELDVSDEEDEGVRVSQPLHYSNLSTSGKGTPGTAAYERKLQELEQARLRLAEMEKRRSKATGQLPPLAEARSNNLLTSIAGASQIADTAEQPRVEHGGEGNTISPYTSTLPGISAQPTYAEQQESQTVILEHDAKDVDENMDDDEEFDDIYKNDGAVQSTTVGENEEQDNKSDGWSVTENGEDLDDNDPDSAESLQSERENATNGVAIHHTNETNTSTDISAHPESHQGSIQTDVHQPAIDNIASNEIAEVNAQDQSAATVLQDEASEPGMSHEPVQDDLQYEPAEVNLPDEFNDTVEQHLLDKHVQDGMEKEADDRLNRDSLHNSGENDAVAENARSRSSEPGQDDHHPDVANQSVESGQTPRAQAQEVYDAAEASDSSMDTSDSWDEDEDEDRLDDTTTDTATNTATAASHLKDVIEQAYSPAEDSAERLPVASDRSNKWVAKSVFKPYVSPLTTLKATNQMIDPFTPLCPAETSGYACATPGCGFVHFKDVSSSAS